MHLAQDILLKAGLQRELFNIKRDSKYDHDHSNMPIMYVKNLLLEEIEELLDSMYLNMNNFYYRTLIIHPDTEKVYLEVITHYQLQDNGLLKKEDYLSTTIQEKEYLEKDVHSQFFELDRIQELEKTNQKINLFQLEDNMKEQVLIYLAKKGMILSAPSITESAD